MGWREVKSIPSTLSILSSPLPYNFVQRDGTGDTGVERGDAAFHGQASDKVTSLADKA
jgi:hypothetical protein